MSDKVKLRVDLTSKEDIANKVTSITSSSTNTHYPTAKAVYDALVEVTANNSGNYIYDFYHDTSTDDIVLEYDSASGGAIGSNTSYANATHSHTYNDLTNVTTVEVTVTYTDNSTETIKLLKYTGT